MDVLVPAKEASKTGTVLINPRRLDFIGKVLRVRGAPTTTHKYSVTVKHQQFRVHDSLYPTAMTALSYSIQLFDVEYR